MRQTHFEEPAIIPAELSLVTIVIHGIAGSFFKQKHRQAGCQQFGLFILGGLLADLANVPQPVKQVREQFMDGVYDLENDIGLLKFSKTG